jgi:uncharacterized protein (TIGR00299 family) protein
MRLAWVDAGNGISGDMLLGACLDAGVPLGVVRAAVDRLALPESVTIDAAPAMRGGLGATRAVVRVAESRTERTLDDVLSLLDGAEAEIADRAGAVFRALAAAEARVHRMPIDRVHFHEVGALDSIADVVGGVAALRALGADRLHCSPIALGGGRAPSEHGPVPVPGPAVLELLAARGAPGFGGPLDVELATPTGVALMTALADDFGPLPRLEPEAVGTGAGGRDPAGHANVTRVVVGTAEPAPEPSLPPAEPAVVLAANVDDLDPRLWPAILADLLAAGAADAWLTPIVMKKGRPAHTLSVLAEPGRVADLERIVLTATSTIGLRRQAVAKRVLPRESVTVTVFDRPVRVKLARLDGVVVNAAPEYDDVARVAAESGRPAKVVLDAARAAAADLLADG